MGIQEGPRIQELIYERHTKDLFDLKLIASKTLVK